MPRLWFIRNWRKVNMKLNGKFRVFALAIFSLTLAAGSAFATGPATPELEDPALLIPDDVERKELEGSVLEVHPKEMRFTLNEDKIQWSAATEFLDVRGGPLKDALPEAGTRVRVIGVEILDGFLALTVQRL